jgi:hypothetical protein
VKACPVCGYSFTGFSDLCDVCRRRYPNWVKPVTPVTESIEIEPQTVTTVTKSVPNEVPAVTLVTSLDDERDALLSRLAEINAILGPMTAAERQRRRRAKQQARSSE